MATAPVLEAAPDPLASVPAVKPDTWLDFEIEDYDTPVELDMANIPQPVRMRLLRSATKSYIINRVSTAVNKTNKANAPFANYAAAMQNDPLQQIVPKPEGEKAVTPYAEIVDGAIKALYSGQLGKRGTGEAKPKVLRNPLITQITRSVVAEVYEKERALNPSYKYPTAQKEVGQDGLQYLKDKIALKVAAGADEGALNKYLETRYINPAKIMLGIDTPKTIKDADAIL